MSTEKYIGEAKIKEKPKHKIDLVIRKGSVTWDKLSSDVRAIIESGGGSSVPLADDFGNSELVGITQKKLTEAHNDLQEQINDIIAGGTTVRIAASATTFFVGSRTFILTASSDADANIVIKQGSNVIESGSGKSLAASVSVSQATAGSIVYTAEFTFAGGAKKTATVTIYFVNKIYAGGGSVYTAVTNDAHALSEAKRNAAGTYNITVAQNGQYVFFVIPSTMSISKATMSGFDFPLDAATVVTVDGVSYKSYRSSNTYDAGSYQIILT